MENFQYIALKDIRTNPYQPRKEFSKKIEELQHQSKKMVSFSQSFFGNLHFLVMKFQQENGDLELPSFLGLETIPAVVKELSDDDMLKQAIIENLQREDLNLQKKLSLIKNLIDKGLTHDKKLLKSWKIQTLYQQYCQTFTAA